MAARSAGPALLDGAVSALAGLAACARAHGTLRPHRGRARRILLLTLAVEALLVLLAAQVLPAPAPGAGAGAFLAAMLAWAAVGAAILLGTPVLVALGTGLLLPLFGERIFLAALAHWDAGRARALARRPAPSLRRTLQKCLLRLGLWTAGTLAAALLAAVPVAGPVLALAGGAAVSAWLLGWELFDPWLDRTVVGPRAQLRFARAHAARLVGFGMPMLALLAVPLLGPFFFVWVQAAAGHAAAAGALGDPPQAPLSFPGNERRTP